MSLDIQSYKPSDLSIVFHFSEKILNKTLATIKCIYEASPIFNLYYISNFLNMFICRYKTFSFRAYIVLFWLPHIFSEGLCIKSLRSYKAYLI